jgi:hypothetical protein
MPVYSPAKIKQVNSQTFKLFDATDIDTGTLDKFINLISGGRIVASGIAGEIVPQTGAGAPSHSATRGTLYWDTSGNALYSNNNGSTSWSSVGGTSYTNEEAQDAVGTILVATPTITLGYSDTTPQISGVVNDASITYTKIQNVSATDKLLGRSTAGAGNIEEIACTSFGRSLIDDADASAGRTTLGVAIGTNVQAYDATLQSISALGTAANRIIYTTGVDTWAELASNSSATKYYLQTYSDGAPAWAQVAYGDLSGVPSTFTPAAHNILDSTKHGDATTASVTRGDLIIGSGVSPTWFRLPKGSANSYLKSDGTDISWSTGLLSIAAAKTLTVSNTLTLTATDGSTLAIGTGGTLGTAAYTATTAYEAAGSIATHAALTATHGVSGAIVGTTDTQTLSNKTLTAPKFTNGGYISDDAGTPVKFLSFSTVASAVNYFQITNAATLDEPIFSAVGSDSNIDMQFQAKGTGKYTFLSSSVKSAEIRLYENTTNGTDYVALQAADNTESVTFTLPINIGVSGQVLATDGLSQMYWLSSAGGGMTDPGGNGIVVRTALNTTINRSIAVVANTGLAVSNADGVSGNPTLSGINASTTVKGVASFNSTNFSTSSGAVNTIQDINTGATPTFDGIYVTSLFAGAGEPRLIQSGNAGLLQNISYTDGLIIVNTTGAPSAISNVVIGQVLVSAGVGELPTWTASPSLTSLTLSTALSAAYGGTGHAGGYTKGDLLVGSGINTLSILNSGVNNYVLTVDSTKTLGLTWAQVSYTNLSNVPSTFTPSTHSLLDSTKHGDTTTGTVVRGDIITGQGGPPSWTRLAKGSANSYLKSDGTDISWSAGLLSIASAKTLIVNNSLSFTAVDGTVVDLRSGVKGDLLIGSGLNTFSVLGSGVDGQVLTVDSTYPLGLKWATGGGPGGGVTTVGSLDGGTEDANGANISSTTIYMQSATATIPGLVTTTSQTFAGDKTFTGVIIAPTHVGGIANTSTITIKPSSHASATTGADIIFNVGASGNTQAMRIFNNSDVLIGTGTTHSALLHVLQSAGTTGNPKMILFDAAAHTGVTNSAETIDIDLDMSATLTYVTGSASITNQRSMVIRPRTFTRSVSGTTSITYATTLSILGAPVESTGVAITYSVATWIHTSDVGGVVTSFGLICEAPTGATNNNAAAFIGPVLIAGGLLTQNGFLKISSPTTSTKSIMEVVTGATTAYDFTYPLIHFDLDGAITSTTATGTIAFAKGIAIDAPNYNRASASVTLTEAATLWIEGPLVNYSADVAITTAYGIYVGATGTTPTNVYGLYIVGPTNGTNKYAAALMGKTGINVAAPTALLHLPAGTTAAATAPLKFTSGTNLTATEAGAVEYDGSHVYLTTTDTVRHKIVKAAYGSFYDNASAATITVTTAGTYYGYISATTGANLSLVSFTGDGTADRLTISTGGAGLYLASYSFTFSSGTGLRITTGQLFKNGAGIADSKAAEYAATAAKSYNMAMSVIVSLAATDYIDFRITNSTNGTVITVDYLEVNLIRIG